MDQLVPFGTVGTIAYLDVPLVPILVRMGTKLIKLWVSEQLHRRIKTLAASKDKKIPDYAIEILEKHVPRAVNFPAKDEPNEEEQQTK